MYEKYVKIVFKDVKKYQTRSLIIEGILFLLSEDYRCGESLTDILDVDRCCDM